MHEYINLILISFVAIYAMVVHMLVIKIKIYNLKLLDEIKTNQLNFEKQKSEAMLKAFKRIVETNKKG